MDEAPRKAQKPAIAWAPILAIALAAPMGLALESALRSALFPPEIDELRADLGPTLTPIAWIFVLLTLLAVPLGIWAMRRHRGRAIARMDNLPNDAQRRRADFESLLLGTSIAQLPSLISTLLSMFGASIVPVIAGIAVSTIAVFAMGVLRL